MIYNDYEVNLSNVIVSNVAPEIPFQHDIRLFFYCLDSIDTVWSLPDLSVKMTSVALTTMHLFLSDLYMLSLVEIFSK